MFVGQLNDFLGRINEAGLLAIYKNWCRYSMKTDLQLNGNQNDQHLITFEAIWPLFLLYVYLIGVSVTVFLGELIIDWVKRQ